MNCSNSRRLEFSGIDKSTAEILRANKKFIMDSLPGVLNEFYQRVVNEPEVATFFSSPTHIAHAKEMQIRHWDIITDAKFDQEYVDSVTRVGEVHNKLGLEPRWYIGAYSMLLSGLISKLIASTGGGSFFGGGKANTSLSVTALIKAAMLDMDYAISVYIDAGKRDRQNTLSELSRIFESSVCSVSDKLNKVSVRLNATAGELIEAFDKTDRNATSADQSASLVATNINMVAAASEELASSVSEIGRQVTQSYRISEEAASNSTAAITTMSSLTNAAGRVGEIVSLINDIAGKTNLLALNATIEAARAGEAGKGFAVVATEVKGLAEQTARATADISSQIEEIQTIIGSSAQAIDNVHETISQLNEIAAEIAAAVEQQEAATVEISQNIQQAAGGANEASRSITIINSSAKQTQTEAHKVNTETADLSAEAERLQFVSSDFLAKVAAM